jgi:hypothetical protein
MSSATLSLIVLACVFGGGLLGMFLQRVLPDHHLSAKSENVVKLLTGLVGTMAALVLGLLVASAKGSYDAQSAELTQLAADVAFLDRILAHYGPETKETRAVLRPAVIQFIDQMWSKDAAPRLTPQFATEEIVYEKLQALSPKDDRQRSLQSHAIRIVFDLGKTRWLMYEQGTKSVSLPLLIVLVLWLTAIFVSFGLFAPFNATAVSSLFVSALAVSGAIFLILEMYSPYTGVVKISDAPLRAVIANLGR